MPLTFNYILNYQLFLYSREAVLEEIVQPKCCLFTDFETPRQLFRWMLHMPSFSF